MRPPPHTHIPTRTSPPHHPPPLHAHSRDMAKVVAVGKGLVHGSTEQDDDGIPAGTGHAPAEGETEGGVRGDEVGLEESAMIASQRMHLPCLAAGINGLPVYWEALPSLLTWRGWRMPHPFFSAPLPPPSPQQRTALLSHGEDGACRKEHRVGAPVRHKAEVVRICACMHAWGRGSGQGAYIGGEGGEGQGRGAHACMGMQPG